jgi:hypothetical protein
LGGVGLEEVIKRIVAIDKEAETYRFKNRKLLEAKNLEFESQLKKMKDDFEDKLSLEKKTTQDEIMNKANEEIKLTVFKRDESLKKMQSDYNLKAEAVIQVLFQELKEKMKEG